MSLILVVEDNPGMREGLSEVLREAGHEVCEAVDGEEALEIMAHTNFDLAIVDLKLPGINGIEVLRQLKKRDVVETAAIMITAYGTIETAVEAMKLGAKDFITKPISIDELELKVKTHA